MSEIADALKKLKDSNNGRKPTGSYSKKYSFPHFKLSTLYILAVFIILVIPAGLYYYHTQKIINNINHTNITPVSVLQNKFNEKLANYQESMSKKNTNDFYLLLLSGNYDKAEKIAEKAENKSLLAMLNFFTGNLSKSKIICENILHRNPENPEILNILSMIYFKMGDFEKSADIQAKIEEENYKTLLNKAVIYEKMGNYSQALSYYSKSLNYMEQTDKPLGESFLKRTLKRKIFMLGKKP
ncbi:tetratricopeptide repeat protein [Flexistipes sinusarabici]|uniref:tetratricopeptide repeat protein n=1 Tax=Flexistipes sinusarabici TaxID=2352 RepID=UPI002356DAC5|nr:tetratricopeptide repeat protein [Flexistipes sinusarabici]